MRLKDSTQILVLIQKECLVPLYHILPGKYAFLYFGRFQQLTYFPHSWVFLRNPICTLFSEVGFFGTASSSVLLWQVTNNCELGRVYEIRCKRKGALSPHKPKLDLKVRYAQRSGWAQASGEAAYVLMFSNVLKEPGPIEPARYCSRPLLLDSTASASISHLSFRPSPSTKFLY